MTYLEKLFADNAVRIGEEGLAILGEDVVVGGAIADALAADASGGPVLIFRVPASESERGRVLLTALGSASKLDVDPAFFAVFGKRRGKKATRAAKARLLFLADDAPRSFLTALTGVTAHVKVAQTTFMNDLSHPVRFELLYDSKLPDPNLLVEESASNPRHQTEQVLISPLMNALKGRIEAFGSDVTVSVKSTYTGFYRTFNFAVAHDHGDGLEVAFNLPPDVPPPARLRDASDWGWASVSVFAQIRHDSDLDAELLGWLRDAYARS